MSHDQQPYQYLYQTITTQICNGTFICGQEFPSQREVCQRYNAGIATVRRVMKLLAEEGYIRIAQGQSSVITYRTSKEAHAEFLVQNREEIVDAYKGLGVLVPILYREGAKWCNESDLYQLDRILNHISKQMELPDYHRLVNAFLTVLLHPLRNQLIVDLEFDSKNYLHIPFVPIPDIGNPFATTFERTKTWFSKAIIQIKRKQFDDFYADASKLYRDSGERVDNYLYASGKYTESSSNRSEDIRWFRIKGHSEPYSRLAMTIARRIIAGEFDSKPYLPSIPKLIEEYNITKNTARRAVSLFNSLGITQTIDKKGSIIMSEGYTSFKSELDLAGPVIQERLSFFLEALQIVALTARCCASSTSSIPDYLGQSVENRLRTASDNRITPSSFQLLMGAFIQLLPYQSLKNIFRQLDGLLIWGYYMQAIDKSCYPDYSEIALAMEAVITALKTQRSDALPDAFSNAFALIYQDACMVLSKLPSGSIFSTLKDPG